MYRWLHLQLKYFSFKTHSVMNQSGWNWIGVTWILLTSLLTCWFIFFGTCAWVCLCECAGFGSGLLVGGVTRVVGGWRNEGCWWVTIPPISPHIQVTRWGSDGHTQSSCLTQKGYPPREHLMSGVRGPRKHCTTRVLKTFQVFSKKFCSGWVLLVPNLNNLGVFLRFWIETEFNFLHREKLSRQDYLDYLKTWAKSGDMAVLELTFKIVSLRTWSKNWIGYWQLFDEIFGYDTVKTQSWHFFPFFSTSRNHPKSWVQVHP